MHQRRDKKQVERRVERLEVQADKREEEEEEEEEDWSE